MHIEEDVVPSKAADYKAPDAEKSRYAFWRRYFAGLPAREKAVLKKASKPTRFEMLLDKGAWLELDEHVRHHKRIDRRALAQYFRSLEIARGRPTGPINPISDQCLCLVNAGCYDWRRKSGRQRVGADDLRPIIKRAKADMLKIHGRLPASLTDDEILRRLHKRSRR
jgi:hypothetical protein